MKRIVPLILAALLLYGCSRTETEASTQTTVPHTQPTGLHILDHETETATSGAVRVYNITGTWLCMVEDGVAVSGEGGKLTVLDREEGLILHTQANMTNILAAEGSHIYYYDGSIRRYDLSGGQTDSWKLPQDTIGDFALGTQTGEIYYCVSGGIYALDMQTGLSRLLKQHSYTEQTLLGAWFGGSVLGWQTEAGIAYLSSSDGSELYREEGIRALYTHQEQYLALRLDGMVEQVIAGARDQDAQLVKLPKEGLVPALAMNGLVQLGEGLRLSYYDLTTGRKTAAVALPDQSGVVAAAAENGFVWVLTDTALYRWEIAKSPFTDETVYTGTLYTPQNPDPEGMAQCESRVRQINKTYGVRVRIGQDAADQPGETELTVEHQPEAINFMLDSLEPLLGRFPKSFLKKTVESGWVRICLVRQVNGQAGYARYWVDGDCYIAIALGADMQEAFLTGLGGAVDSHILGNSRDLEYWEAMNPEGFAYTYGEPVPEDYAQYVGKYFVHETSMMNPSEDRARIFRFAMTEGNETLFLEPALQAKLKTLCEGIREAYGLKKSTETFLWEQYLEESLAYEK